MYKCGFYVCFIVFVIVCFVNCAKERCDGSCIRAESCRFFGNLQKEEQTIWLNRFVCEESSNKPPGAVYGFSSSAKGDIVCCPENIWQIDNSTQTEEQTGGNYQAAGLNIEDSVPLEKNSFFSNYNKPNQNYAYPNNGGNSRYEDPRYYQNQNANNGLATDDETNLYENTRIWQNRRRQQPVQNPYFLAANQNPGSSFRRPEDKSNGRQCAVTSFPPEPDSGCCGREATDADRITASQYPQSNPAYTTQSSWMPQMNQPSPGSWQSWAPYSDRTKRDSGNVNVTFDNRIAGGKETELEQFPWTVLLKTTFVYPTKEASFSCGGSLISSRYVLTAGHCVYDAQGSIKDVEIYLAEYDKRTFPRDCKNVLGRGQQCIDNIVMHAENVHLHPQYDDDRLHNDISLIRLRGSVPYTEYIRPICLPTMNVDSPQLSNLRLAVAGWGRNGQYKSNIKQSTVVNLVPQSDCRSSYPGLTRQQLCAAGYTGEDTCKGDSGGPLMMLYGGKYFVAGVVSGKRADAPCGTSVPSLYTNVYQYLQWIRSVIQN